MIQRKVCLIGDTGVGKSSIFNRFVYDRWLAGYHRSIGIRLQRRALGDVPLLIWDVEGTHCHGLPPYTYLGGAACTIIVCDLTRIATLKRCLLHATEIRKRFPHMPLVIAANKLDRAVLEPAHVRYARRIAGVLDVPLRLTSARSGKGITALFHCAAQQIAGILVPITPAPGVTAEVSPARATLVLPQE